MSPLEIELIIIKANRFIRKRQLSMFPVLSPFLKETPSKDKQAAELFLRKRAKIPLYSGFNNIVEASNYNVEQFLRVFSPFVDRLIYRVQLDKDLHIQPSEQYKILQRAAKSYLENIISKLLYGKLIYRFVDNLGRYFSHRTYEPNAPHAPGITQFAISSSDMDRISKKTNHKENPWIDEIIRVLTIAISNNVIVPENSQHQGAKGSEKKYLFSLNRLLCINYDLPMQRGDFQLFTLDFLWEICNNSFKPDEIKRRKLNKQQKLWE